MRIILVTGMPGSGKTVVVEVASREFNLPRYSMGDVVREEALRIYGSMSADTLLKTAKILRDTYGLDYIARKTVERINASRSVVVIDGVRSLEEVEAFRRIGETVIIAVHASPKTRFERLRRRGRLGDPVKWEDFVTRDLVELSLGIGNVIALADIVVVNEKPLDEFVKEVKEVLGRVLGVACDKDHC